MVTSRSLLNIRTVSDSSGRRGNSPLSMPHELQMGYRLHLFHSAQERVLMRPCVFVYLGYLGFCHLTGEHTADALSSRVYMKHHLHRPLLVHAEETAQYLDHEIHRCEVGVQQDDLEQRRP